MKNKTINFVIAILFLAGFNVAQTFAQEPLTQEPLKGQWTFHTQAIGRTVDIHAFFKKNNTGFILGGTEGTLPLIYHQKNNQVNVTFETPALADYSDVTVVFNGTLSDSNNISGNATVVTNQPDPFNPNGFVTFTLVITGQRDQ